MRSRSRMILSLALAVSAFAFTAGSASAQRYDDRYYGGGLARDLPNFFGSLFGQGGIRAIPRQTVAYPVSHKPGTIVISTRERRLYLMVAPGQAIRYGIGVGKEGFQWAGVKNITRKAEWPSWTPPAQMLRRRPDLPRFMKGGPENPLGARAMYLGSSLYRIHGSNEPETIGTAVSSGCIRMTNDDVIDLYNRVQVGTRVIVQR